MIIQIWRIQEIVTEKISLGKRKKWLQIISEKTGL